MKKILCLQVVLLLLFALTATAVAEDDAGKAKVAFTYGGNMWLYGIMYQQAGSGAESSQVRMRIRQYLTAALGGMKGVVKFESDPVFGENVGVGTDYYSNGTGAAKGIELKNAYMQFNTEKFEFKGGLMYADMIGGDVFGGLMSWEDVPAIEITYKASKDFALKAIWIREKSGNPDIDYFSLDAGFKVSGFDIRVGAVGSHWNNTVGENWLGLAPQAHLIGKLGEKVSLGVTGGFGMTIKDEGGTSDITGGSLNIDLKIDLKPLTVNPFVLVAAKNWGYFAPAYAPYPSKTQYFWFGFPIAALRGYGYESVFDPSRDGGNLGVLNPGIKITYAATDKLDLYATYALFKGMNDKVAGGDEIMGHEIDLGFFWTVMQGVKIHAGCDLFLANKDSALNGGGDVKGYQAFIGTQIAW